MYTRDYSDDISDIRVPKNYAGTAISSEEEPEPTEDVPSAKMVENKENIPSWFDKIQLKSLFGGVGSLFSGKTKLGFEELIIIGLIAFLIFSKNYDIECIIMLAALLLI